MFGDQRASWLVDCIWDLGGSGTGGGVYIGSDVLVIFPIGVPMAGTLSLRRWLRTAALADHLAPGDVNDTEMKHL